MIMIYKLKYQVDKYYSVNTNYSVLRSVFIRTAVLRRASSELQ